LLRLFLVFLAMEVLMFGAYGDWGTGLFAAGVQVVGFGGLWWGLLWGQGLVQRWWHTLLVLVVLGGLLSGCTDVVRGVAKLHGYKGDIYAQPCLPESLQAGHCVTAVQQEKKP
jgi:hypothetical protein